MSLDTQAVSGQSDSACSDLGKTISIYLPTDLYFNSGIRDFAANFVRNMTDLSEKWAYRFQTIVDELCNNAIEHGSKAGDTIHVSFTFSSCDIIVVVEDNGSGESATNAAALAKRLEELRVQNANPLANLSLRGRGIVKIVESWTDSIHYEDRPQGGLKVTVKKGIEAARKEDAEMNEVKGVSFK
jgi:anti-sigma regulatory factor (Ser/Thr protein kinase)